MKKEINLLTENGKTDLDLHPKPINGYDLVFTVETDSYVVRHSVDFEALYTIIKSYKEVLQEES